MNNNVIKLVQVTAEKFDFVCVALFVCFGIKFELSRHVKLAADQKAQQQVTPSHEESNTPYSIQWDLRQPEGTQAGLQAEGCGHGTPVARVCFSAQCLSLRSSVRCLRFSALGFPHSRSWEIQHKPIALVSQCILQQWAHSVSKSLLLIFIVCFN